MQFVIIRPREQTVETVNVDELREAQRLAGFDAFDYRVDFGVIRHGLSITVYEFGMFAKPSETFYFGLAQRLYAGNAVLFAYDDAGDTVSIDPKLVPPPLWFPTHQAVEMAIANRLIARPEIAVNGVVTWQWPER